MVGAARRSNGRKEQTSFCIVDSQSVKNTDSAEQKGYDAGKKVSGIKRHIAVDTQGLPHAIHVTTANVTDRAGALAMFDQRRDGLSLVQNVLVDGGYTGDPFAAGVQSLLGASVEVVKRNEMHTFVVLPKRWVVERSFAWLEKCRRLWKNCERKLNTSLQMVVLAFAALILKRLQTGSKVEWHQGELFSRVGFIVTNLSYPNIGIVRFYNGRGTAEQWIKEGKYALNWTRLSCHKFVANQVRLELFVLAYNLGNSMRRLALPEAMKHWSLTSLQTRMIKTGGRLVRHAGRLVFQLAEVLVSREMLGGILERIGRLRLAPG